MSNTVPEGWERKLIKDTVSTVIAGQSPNRKDHAAKAGKYGILKTTAIDWGKYSPDKNQEVLDDFKVNPKHEVKTGDVLITKAGPVHRVGVVTYVPETPEKMLVSGKMTLLRTSSLHDSRFLSYALATEYSQKPLKESTTGMALSQTNFTHETLLQVPLWVPQALPEQQKIAAILSSVDDVIAKTRAQIDKLKDLKTGMVQELLTKGIGSGCAPHKEFKDSPVGRIPARWEVCTADDISDAIMVGVVIKPTQYYVDKGVPALRSANVRENGLTKDNLKYFSPASNDRLHKSKLRKGDLLTVRTGYPGTTAVVTDEFEGCNCIDVVITRPSAKMDSDFFCLWVNSDHGKGQVLKAQGGLAQQHFNVGDMKNLLVAVPPLDEQRSIYRAVSSAMGKLSMSEGKLARLNNLKKALMQDLLTGKVRVKLGEKETAVA